MKIKKTFTQNRRGMAVIVMLALLSIILVCLGTGIRSLNRLDRELKLLEQHQTRRLAASCATNLPAALQPSKP